MKSIVYIIFCIIFLTAQDIFAQPANDNCASATTLTIGAALSCSQTTQNATLQGSECYTNYGGGSTEYTTWYRITANNDSLILNFIQTNSTNCFPHIAVYGPFASGAGCLPACGTQIYNVIQNGDPGSHILLTGLATTGNRDYLIQIQNNDCGGPGSAFTNFCINVQQPATTATSSGALQLNACGTAFSNTTNGGYWQNGTSTGFNNLDNNNGTTCGGCTAGDDTPFIINNVSWSYFCSLTAGTWQVTVNGVSGCTLAAPNQGVQASLFTGTTSALVNQGNSQNPISPGGSWTSGTITVNAGQCAYLMIDGFAGDACNYNVTLTNLSGGCIVLPIEMISFEAIEFENEIELKWVTAVEINNDYFILEKSKDGENFEFLSLVDGAGNSSQISNYNFKDRTPLSGTSYYRLKQVDYDGNVTISGVVKLKKPDEEISDFVVYPNPVPQGILPSLTLSGETNEIIEVNIYDVSGKLVFSKNHTLLTKQAETLELNLILNSGIYFISTNKNGKTKTEKLIIN